MNLHKAKGLEAEVVFLADPAGGYSLKVDEHIRRDGDQAVGWFKVMKASDKPWSAPLLGQPADWDLYEAEEERYRQAEEHRLLYVAATRAREMLVISRVAGDKYPAWGALTNFLGTAQELVIPANVAVPVIEPADTSKATEAAFIKVSESGHAAARQPSWSVSSVTAETRHIARIARSEEAGADDPTKVVGTNTPAHRADAGAAWGTLIHGLLEHAMRHPNATREDLRRLAMWLTVEEPQLRPAIDQAIDTVQRVATADFWAQAKAGVHFEETPFIVAHGTPARRSPSEGGDLMAGVIDLLYESGGGWHVRDYKTDVSLEPSAYAGQLKAYRLALEAVKCRVVDASLVHVREGKGW
jgi:ATP-dependent helicase/nuclease subunit A